MRSLDLPVGLLYPWDSMLLEAGALAMLLPTLDPIWLSARLAATPHPWLCAAFRWLLVRVLLGFGKKKFMNTDLTHSCYIKNFLVAQPIPSPLGWLACRLPLPLFQAALVVMFVVECVAPFFLLPTGIGRAVAALAIAALMLGIQLGGNFGHFNILTAALCIGCLDTASSAFDELPVASSSLAEVSMSAVLAAYCLLGALFLLFDSWCTTAWTYWAQLALARKPAVRSLVGLCRF